jgi:dTDP-4-dehydrorhamnose 3,5-epimerase
VSGILLSFLKKYTFSHYSSPFSLLNVVLYYWHFTTILSGGIMIIELTDDVMAALTIQQYGAQPQIDGVFYHPLKKHRALESDFMEYMRLTGGTMDNFPHQFEPRQISLATAAPGRINAFHLHPKVEQNEMWCVIAGRMKAWLVDIRKDSPTVGVKRQFVLNGEEPGFLFIPTGVAHGFQSGRDGATLLYAMNSQFNFDDPNEGRLPWDFFGADLWEADRG